MSHIILSFRPGSGRARMRAMGSRLSSRYAPDVKFLRSWLVYDSGLDSEGHPRKFNWSFLLGLVLVAGLSAGFWVGVGMVISGAWR